MRWYKGNNGRTFICVVYGRSKKSYLAYLHIYTVLKQKSKVKLKIIGKFKNAVTKTMQQEKQNINKMTARLATDDVK